MLLFSFSMKEENRKIFDEIVEQNYETSQFEWYFPNPWKIWKKNNNNNQGVEEERAEKQFEYLNIKYTIQAFTVLIPRGFAT